MDGWSGAAGTSGELRAGIEGSLGGVAYEDGHAGTSKAGQMGKPTRFIKKHLFDNVFVC